MLIRSCARPLVVSTVVMFLSLTPAFAQTGPLAEQARVALAAFRPGSATDPSLARNTLTAAESFESAFNALASRRNEIRKKLEQALPR